MMSLQTLQKLREERGIKIEGKNRWKTIIQNASKNGKSFREL
jgi:hypothetical protein